MSIVAIDWAIRQQCPPTEKLILIVLANRANNAAECWPSMQSVVEDTGLSERSIQAAIRSMRGKGLVTVEAGGGRNRTNLYRLHIRETPQDTHETPQMPHPHADSQTPQNLHETPQILYETPQVVRETPQHLHPEPSEPSTEPRMNRHSTRERPQMVLLGVREEAINSPLPEPPDPPPPKPKRTRTRADQRTQLSDEWYPDDVGVAFARSRGVNVEREVIAFRAHHIARGNRMASWPQAWRTWCMNDEKFRGNGRGSPPRPTSGERVLGTMRALIDPGGMNGTGGFPTYDHQPEHDPNHPAWAAD